jgi:hypothetical protein
MKGYFFGPVTTKKIIKFANTSIFTDLANGQYSTTPSERIRIYPGLLANGDPANYTSEQTIQATATASISGGSLSSITIVNSGLGYNGATVTVSNPDTGSNTATAVANVQSDYIQDIVITSGGSGYNSAPTITISSPDDVSIDYANVNISDDWDYVVVIDSIGDL